MHRHAETRRLPFTPQQLFDLVADIARYPEFLPWCIASRITHREGNLVWADLVIGKGPFRETFTSKVTLDVGLGDNGAENSHPPRIDVEYVKGPMRQMANHWIFRGVEGGTEIDFSVELEFKSRLLESMMGALFDDAVRRMVDAFDARAKDLYGPA